MRSATLLGPRCWWCARPPCLPAPACRSGCRPAPATHRPPHPPPAPACSEERTLRIRPFQLSVFLGGRGCTTAQCGSPQAVPAHEAGPTAAASRESLASVASAAASSRCGICSTSGRADCREGGGRAGCGSSHLQSCPGMQCARAVWGMGISAVHRRCRSGGNAVQRHPCLASFTSAGWVAASRSSAH